MEQLRDRQRAATRDQIIQAVHDVLTEESPASLSMPRVAERAGTSLRTLYRYFPTKQALVDAASESFTVKVEDFGRAVTVGNVGEYLQTAWSGFTKGIAAVKAQHLTPAGRALREARLPRSRKATRDVLRRGGIELPKKDEAKLVDLVVALISSSMYLELVDRMGWDDEEAAELAAWAATTVVERAQREGGIR